MAAIFIECSSRIVSIEKNLMGGGGHMTIDCFGVEVDRIGEAKVNLFELLDEHSDAFLFWLMRFYVHLTSGVLQESAL